MISLDVYRRSAFEREEPLRLQHLKMIVLGRNELELASLFLIVGAMRISFANNEQHLHPTAARSRQRVSSLPHRAYIARV